MHPLLVIAFLFSLVLVCKGAEINAKGDELNIQIGLSFIGILVFLYASSMVLLNALTKLAK